MSIEKRIVIETVSKNADLGFATREGLTGRTVVFRARVSGVPRHDTGMLVDFKTLKETMQGVLAKIDHFLVVPAPLRQSSREIVTPSYRLSLRQDCVGGHTTIFEVPTEGWESARAAICLELAYDLEEALPTSVRVEGVEALDPVPSRVGYAHCLPAYDGPCSRLHGHTCLVSCPQDPAFEAHVRQRIRDRLLCSRSEISPLKEGRVLVSNSVFGGDFPASGVLPLDGPSTIETLISSFGVPIGCTLSLSEGEKNVCHYPC